MFDAISTDRRLVNLADLARQIRARFVGIEAGMKTEGRLLFSRHYPSDVIHKTFAEASVTLMTSGQKEARLAGGVHAFRKGMVLVCAVGLSDDFKVLPSSDEDLTAVSIRLDDDMMHRALARHHPQHEQTQATVAGDIADDALIDAFQRRLSFGASPTDKALSELVEEEILVRVLATPAGAVLTRLFNPASVENRIRRSIGWLRLHYRESFEIETVAAEAGMSPATYYRHFKTLVNESPRQYVKMLRLHEARKLMVTERITAEQAAYEVGYDSPHHFNREFKRLFGESPRRHVVNLADS